MSRGATARLFVAVDPPPSVGEELIAWGRRAVGAGAPLATRGAPGPARLLDPEALHVTLCFLGSRPVGEIAAIEAALQECSMPVGELRLGAPMWLPSRNPRVLAVEVTDRAGHLARLQGAVCAALAQAIDWQAERRRFRAHMTVARARGGGRRRPRVRGVRPEVFEGGSLPATPPLSFTPRSAVLYRSRLSPAGASYEPLASCELLAGTG